MQRQLLTGAEAAGLVGGAPRERSPPSVAAQPDPQADGNAVVASSHLFRRKEPVMWRSEAKRVEKFINDKEQGDQQAQKLVFDPKEGKIRVLNPKDPDGRVLEYGASDSTFTQDARGPEASVAG